MRDQRTVGPSRSKRRSGLTSWIHDHKPAAPARVHALLAALMWTIVGGALATTGLIWSLSLGWRTTAVLLSCGIILGLVKSRLALDRVARRIVARIETRGEGRCLGGFLSIRSWALVAVMAVGGRVLRAHLGATWVVDLLYITVGAALLLSSRLIWIGWRKRAASRRS